MRRWIVPIGVGVLGIALSCLTFLIADRADHDRAYEALAFRTEWRARDLEAKVRLAGEAAANVAIALTANPALGPDGFSHVARRARLNRVYVNSLQWVPRVPRERVVEFERAARVWFPDYRVFEVTPEFQPTALSDREVYYPVLFEERFSNKRRVQGLSLGKYDGRRLPMERARDSGRPVAALPVRPIGRSTSDTVLLVFWPVYGSTEDPDTVEARRTLLRGFALGNYNVAALLTAAVGETPDIVATIHVAIAAEHGTDVGQASAVYVAGNEAFQSGPLAPDQSSDVQARMVRHFAAFGLHWDVTFDYDTAVVANLRTRGAWGWLASGLLLTALLVSYFLYALRRQRQVEALVAERTAELQRTAEQLQQAQKMEAIGNLTGGMAHDFNNLLAVVIGNTELLRERLRDDQRARALADLVLQAGQRGAELTRRLLAFARRQPLEPRPTDVNKLVAGTAQLLERILEQDIDTRLVTAPDLWPVMIDPAQLNAALVNLATNARDAMPGGGQLTIETRNAQLDADYVALNPEAEPGDYVLLEVSDTGGGMAAETMAKAFEPFFTTKEVGRGTGLGLSMVFGFVKQSRGHIKIYSEIGQGTSVRLYLPRASGDAVPMASDETPATTGGSETILLVEDDPDVRQTAAAQLRALGYRVLEASGADEALALLRQPDAAVDLLFTDIVMPGGMDGRELARIARAGWPGLKVLFTSGYSGTALREHNRLRDDEHFLSKPYRRHELAAKLAELFGRGEAL